MHILVNNKFLVYKDYKVKCALGKRGIAKKKREGDLITPKGLFKIKYLLYRKDRIKKITTKLKKVILKKNMGWCNDSKSLYYNKIIKLPSSYDHERLYKTNNTYDIVLVLNYNMNPIKKNLGSAIFLHIAKKNYEKTEGCVAIKKRGLLKILKKIKKSTKVKIEIQR